ncbi:MAG: glycosyltransferase [Alphaproteobacteria bacterium]|nr:glycosyltransferase [Alphaproteobacteria bacterium]
MKILQNLLLRVPAIPMPSGWFGFAIYTVVLAAIWYNLPPLYITGHAATATFTIGAIALWRYGWGLTNLIRAAIYTKLVFPRWRARVSQHVEELLPPKIYFLITTYRVKTETSIQTIHAAVVEAIASGVPVTIVASIVEMADELLYKKIFTDLNPPSHIVLKIVRIPGTGKRDALAQGFKAISRDNPPEGAVVAVIDGDTMLTPGTLRKCTPFFALHPNLGALTTDEICHVPQSSTLFREWFDLRFSQRHIQMASVSLSRRVLTLTGRMSMFRADVVVHPEFIHHVTNDFLDHWRLGRFRFLTGDDKSSLYWVLKQGLEQIYVPDVRVVTMEEPVTGVFVVDATKLMFRWFGNQMRTNARILALTPARMPLFVWWSAFDQRLSMWTTLAGPTFAFMITIQGGIIPLLYYFAWVGFTRWIMAMTLLFSRPSVNWRYPFLLYFNQVYGSIIKVYVMFRLDRQSWTRQKTKLNRDITGWKAIWMQYSSAFVNAVAVIVFVAAIGWFTHVFKLPETAFCQLFTCTDRNFL